MRIIEPIIKRANVPVPSLPSSPLKRHIAFSSNSGAFVDVQTTSSKQYLPIENTPSENGITSNHTAEAAVSEKRYYARSTSAGEMDLDSKAESEPFSATSKVNNIVSPPGSPSTLFSVPYSPTTKPLQQQQQQHHVTLALVHHSRFSKASIPKKRRFVEEKLSNRPNKSNAGVVPSISQGLSLSFWSFYCCK